MSNKAFDKDKPIPEWEELVGREKIGVDKKQAVPNIVVCGTIMPDTILSESKSIMCPHFQVWCNPTTGRLGKE